jgi:hypothetical protein
MQLIALVENLGPQGEVTLHKVFAYSAESGLRIFGFIRKPKIK